MYGSSTDQAWVRHGSSMGQACMGQQVILAVGGADAVAFALKQLSKSTSMTQTLNRRGRTIY